MSNFHLCVRTIGRSKGQSAIAASAYRAGMLGEPMSDPDTGRIYNYKRKRGVISVKVFIPKDAPEEFYCRKHLWHTATTKEVRCNSTLAREFEFSLPFEIDDTSRTQLIELVCLEIVTRHGCAIEASQHLPTSKKIVVENGREKIDSVSKNYHVHLMLTTRRLGPAGFGEKTRELDCRASGLIRYWRGRIALLINECYERLMLPQRVDHRSLKDQGIQRRAQSHRGPAVNAMIRAGRAGESYVLRSQFNEQRIDELRELDSSLKIASLQAKIEEEQVQLWSLADRLLDDRLNALISETEIAVDNTGDQSLSQHLKGSSEDAGGTGQCRFEGPKG